MSISTISALIQSGSGVLATAYIAEQLASCGGNAELFGIVGITAVTEALPQSLFLEAVRITSVAWLVSRELVTEPVASLSARVRQQMPSFGIMLGIGFMYYGRQV